MNFTVDIFWRSVSGEGEAVNVPGNSYTITGLTPGTTYIITLVAVADGVRSDPISISLTTSRGKYNNFYIANIGLYCNLGLSHATYADVYLCSLQV